MIATNKNGAFTGVSIIPGVMMGLNALSDRTAQLPKVSLEAPTTVIGKNTVDCMKSGVIFGNASMLDGMIDRINREVGEELPVLVTGGYASAIIPHCQHKMIFDKNLVLKGLNIIYKKNK
jgi:type III pantothenate kinase